MACVLPSGPVSYSVVIIPLQSRLCSLDALQFYLRIKRLRDLEREKDCLWSGLEVLEQARLWYHTRLEENRVLQASTSRTKPRHRFSSDGGTEPWFGQLKYRMQRVNGSLGRMMSEPNVTRRKTSLPDALADSDLRWKNTLLAQKVSEKNQQISVLESEKEALIQHLKELQIS